MPCKAFLCRFDLRMGVSEEVLNTEAGHIAQEGRDHAICSPSDLAEKLKTIHEAVYQTEEQLQLLLRGMLDRQWLIARVLIARDIYHAALAHICYLRRLPQETGRAELWPEEVKKGEPRPVLEFRDSLFDH